MAYQYFFLDETSINPGERGTEKTRTVHFIGSQEEVEAFIPEKYDDADFTQPVDGIRWAGADFHIHAVSVSAVDRFEYKINLTARNWKENSGINYEPDNNTDELLNKTSTEITEGGSFTITAKMAGFKVDPQNNGFILDTDYDPVKDNPFTQTLGREHIEVTLKTDIFSVKRYLSGPPENNNGRRANFKGILRFKGSSIIGRAVSQSMTSVEGRDGEKYTEWSQSVEIAPAGYNWRATWTGL